MEKMVVDVLVVGSGVSGLFCALHLKGKKVLLISKKTLEESDSYLAQGGVCVLKDEQDFEVFKEDTLKAGHYENNRRSVDIMISHSQEVIQELIDFGVEFNQCDGQLMYTKEGGHSTNRIVYHQDITGKEIMRKLILACKKNNHIMIKEHTTCLDIVEENGCCVGAVIETEGHPVFIQARDVVLACGGVGGLYKHSTNFSHILGDGLIMAMNHGVKLKDMNYVQIHPTTFYSLEKGRCFLLTESLRGEGAKLYNHAHERFVNEVLPRDIVSGAINEQMRKDGCDHVWLDMRDIGEKRLKEHFPHIYEHCLKNGYDASCEMVPVVPAQHYFMGGIEVNDVSRTSLPHLYAVGETSCNGVHGKNRLASNSLLESLVFSKRAAHDINHNQDKQVIINKDVYYHVKDEKDVKQLKELLGMEENQ